VKTQTVLVTAIALCLGALPATGLCQAAAEYSMTTAGTASATANAGSKMGSALNSALDKTTQKLARPAAERREAGRVPRRFAGMRALPANARPVQSPGSERLSSNRSDAAAKSVVTPCVATPVNAAPGDKANVPCKPDTQVEYPSVVNLSFPKQ
jgi:hypothetical protein